MRVKRILGALVVLALPASALASPSLDFQVVLQQGDSLLDTQGQPTGASYGNLNQVVVGPGGTVALTGSDDSGNSVVLYMTAPHQFETIVSTGDSIGSTPALDNFVNLAISGNQSDGSGTRLTFSGFSQDGTQMGLFQRDIAPGTANQTVAFGTGGSVNIDESSLSAAGGLAYQVNARGQAIFPATNASSQTTLQLGDITAGSVTTTLFTSNVTTQTTSASERLGIYASGTGAANLVSGGNTNVYTVSGGSASILDSSANSLQLVGVGNYGLGNAALFVSGAIAGPFNLVLHDNDGDQTLGSYSSGSNPLGAEMTPNGKIAFYQPGGALKYYDATMTHDGTTTVIANGDGSSIAIDPDGGQTYTIDTLQLGLQSPMINSNGVVVFDALIGDDDHQALLEWYPGLTDPLVLLQAGDSFGSLGQIQDGSIFINTLSSEADVFKDSLSDDGYLAVGATLSPDGGDTTTNVVLLADISIPEPATMAALPLIGMVFWAHRRRPRAAAALA